MRRDQISLQLYTVREQTARDLPGTLRKISEIGHPAVEFAGYGGLAPHDLKTILDDLGLRASGVHVPLDSWETNPETVLVDMHALGCTHAVLPSAPPDRRGEEASVAKLAEDLNRWGSCAVRKASLSRTTITTSSSRRWTGRRCGTCSSGRPTLGSSGWSSTSTGSNTQAPTLRPSCGP